jgi:hypothetical protein
MVAWLTISYLDSAGSFRNLGTFSRIPLITAGCSVSPYSSA